MIRFVAIDFETADYGPDSARAVALVTVIGTRIVKRERYLIRPPLCLHLSPRDRLEAGRWGTNIQRFVANYPNGGF